MCSFKSLRKQRAEVAGWLLAFCAAPCLAQAPLADARLLISQQQAKLGAAPGVIVLDTPARLEGDVTLGLGQSLRLNAPLSVGKSTIHLSGHNEVRCEAEVSVDNATELFVADGATDLSVRGCDVTVRGQPGGTLLTATRSSRVVETGNHVVNMALFNTHNGGGTASQTTDVTISENSAELHGGARPIGVYLLYVLRGVIANNRFMGTGHGIEWWGGDGNLGWHGAAEVKYAGFLSITGNECFDAGGACVWGSMGTNITVTGNTAENCGDVCFDTEGGVRNLFSGNVARGCASGCYSVQMESEDIVFTGNYAYADAKSPTAALVFDQAPQRESGAPQEPDRDRQHPQLWDAVHGLLHGRRSRAGAVAQHLCERRRALCQLHGHGPGERQQLPFHRTDWRAGHLRSIRGRGAYVDDPGQHASGRGAGPQVSLCRAVLERLQQCR